ncbi:hypothetical protein NFI96_007652 [Prochilodus magdalenae]|nr:hypothetical protein NFI96_007652 [Prochilodus magdalenae]
MGLQSGLFAQQSISWRSVLVMRPVIYERYMFGSCKQEGAESIDSFVTRLREKAATCEYEMLWQDLKRAIHARCPSNLSQLADFCKEEWTKIPRSR